MNILTNDGDTDIILLKDSIMEREITIPVRGEIGMKKHGHYCKICGEYKSNESFSGKDHAAHICKKCSSLSPAERSGEMTLTRMMNLPWYLSKEQKAWLKGLQNDRRTDIAETAKELYAARFPFAEQTSGRNNSTSEI